MKEREGLNTARRWAVTAVVAAIALVLNIISYMLMRSGMPGMHFAFYLIAAFSVLVVLYIALWALCAHERCGKLARLLRRFYLVCFAVGVVGFLSLEAVIIAGSGTDDAEVDCVIILGAGLHGETPLAILASRLDAAIEYLKTYEDIPVIVSGGQGPGETITEAEAMRRYLVKRGIDEGRIYKEDESTSTRENLEYSRELMVQMGLDVSGVKVAVVTNEFHLFRAKQIAGRAGLDAVGIAAETPTARLRALYYCREAFGVAALFLLDV